MPPTDLPLPVFYASTLKSLLPVFDDTLSLSDPAAGSTLTAGLNDLHLIGRMLNSLGIFSDNETIDELGDGEMVFMTLGWVVGEAESRNGNGGMAERQAALQRSEVRCQHFRTCKVIVKCRELTHAGGFQHVPGIVDSVQGAAAGRGSGELGNGE